MELGLPIIKRRLIATNCLNLSTSFFTTHSNEQQGGSMIRSEVIEESVVKCLEAVTDCRGY